MREALTSKRNLSHGTAANGRCPITVGLGFYHTWPAWRDFVSHPLVAGFGATAIALVASFTLFVTCKGGFCPVGLETTLPLRLFTMELKIKE
jgi:hypothetical protein